MAAQACVRLIKPALIAHDTTSTMNREEPKRVKPERRPWQWQEGPVDRTAEHFEVRYGNARSSWNEWVPVALVGRAGKRLANVLFLIDRADSENLEPVNQVIRQLRFYLTELRERYPWNYLQYHCGTTSNLYSSVHWAFSPGLAHGKPELSTAQG